MPAAAAHPPLFTTWVTPALFRERTCNRCGDCCESFSLPYKPLQLVAGVARKQFAERINAWTYDLEPLDELDEWGQQLYRCTRFARDADGNGRCTRYDERPETCANYPIDGGYRIAPSQYPRCSWYVGVIKTYRLVDLDGTKYRMPDFVR